ncbi:hypothetical protein BKI52_01405 [marine bacterium AO1-C]|nr:hypothetical protein BKI52_01405 [marine bacterium AO1-C]
MKKTILILICVLCISNLWAQNQRFISGNINDTDTGQPLPGVTLIIKGTNRGVATDVNGYYFLRVNLGDIVVISFIGMETREITIDRNNSRSMYGDFTPSTNTKEPGKPNQYYDYSKTYAPQQLILPNNSVGVGVMNDSLPTYKGKNIQGRISKIRFKRPNRKHPFGRFVVYNVPQEYQRTTSAWKFNWVHTSALNFINRLPRLQNVYAQGRPVNGALQWQGAENGEMFSWGPAISSLSFENSTPYAYDQNGTLVANGNGAGAQAYNPLQFFRTGISTGNVLNISKRLSHNKRIFFQAKDQREWLPISQATTRNNLLRLNFSKNSAWSGYNIQLQYNYQKENLPNRGANWQNIVGSVLTTPPTFDQANGLKRRAALQQTNTYLLNNGTPRSPAPGLLDNPYGLANQMPNEESIERIAGKVLFWKKLRLPHFITYDASELSLDFSTNFDLSKNDYLLGQTPQSAAASQGRMINRQGKSQQVILNMETGLKLGDYSLNFTPTIQQQLGFTRQMVNRENAFGFTTDNFGTLGNAAQINRFNLEYSRWYYQLIPGLKVNIYDNYWKVYAHFANQSYFSSTLISAKNQTYLPDFQVGLQKQDVFQGDLGLTIGFHVHHAKGLQEAALLYNQWAYNSTNSSLANYAQFFERQELGFSNEVSPEIKSQWNYRLNFDFRDFLNIEFVYHDSRTQNLLRPQLQNNQFAWANVGEMRNRGWELFLNLNVRFEADYHWKAFLHWSRYRPIVTQLYQNATSIPLAGYQEVGTHLVADQPYGVIYGNRYLRDGATGQRLIGNDGYPIANPNPVVLGNPNPEWVLQWQNEVKLNRLLISWSLAYQHGGQRWNGTQAMLNYLGVSQQTADLRNVRQFTYAGVNLSGETNQIPVDWANPANGLAGNRWVRYGVGGVAEDYIESATSLRFEELKFTYAFGEFFGIPASTFSVAAFAKNLLVFSPYQGLDPNTTWMSYPGYQGLDLFNAPATTSVGLQLNVTY